MRGRIVMNRLNTGLFSLLFLAATGIVGCSSQQQEDENLETTNEQSDQGDLGNDDAAEGNGQENFVDNDEASQNSGSQGADVNSATADTASTDTLDPTLNGSGGNDTATNATLPGNGAPTNSTAPANAMAGGNMAGGNMAGGNMAGANAAAAAPAGSAPVPGGRVRYVKEGGIQVVNAPNGSPVMTLEQGEHPVTWDENGWLRISNGMYVPVDALSDQGVPRPTMGTVWNAGDGMAH